MEGPRVNVMFFFFKSDTLGPLKTMNIISTVMNLIDL